MGAAIALICVLTAVSAVIVHAHDVHPRSHGQPYWPRPLATTPASYFGLYPDRVPGSYAAITSFTNATGIRPQVVVYYSGWFEPFSASFADAAADHDAVPLVQMNPAGVSVAAIASGRYDGYLIAYAKAVHAYRHPVILSFGHEMNGSWYSWGYRHTAPKVFVAAWRHIVRIFRAKGDKNVTWLWTINRISFAPKRVSNPAAWWPGRSYVTWVGIDGYYRQPSDQFVPLFGPTITAMRELTNDPILIAETAAPRTVGQPAKIADLFAGVRKYGLLGFVWFDNYAYRDYVLSSGAAEASIRRGAETYRRHTP